MVQVDTRSACKAEVGNLRDATMIRCDGPKVVVVLVVRL